MFDLPHLEPTYKVGDLITSISVILALAGFLYTWRRDRTLRTREYADRVRSAAATTLAKIDRCESLFLSFPNNLQPLITEADDLIVATSDEVRTRDTFWKQVTNARLAIHSQFNKEEIELAYAPLLPFREDIYEVFRNAIDEARNAEERFFWSLLNDCQVAILKMAQKEPIMSAELGNVLREIVSTYQDGYARDLRALLSPVRAFLNGIVKSPDRDLIKKA